MSESEDIAMPLCEYVLQGILCVRHHSKRAKKTVAAITPALLLSNTTNQLWKC